MLTLLTKIVTLSGSSRSQPTALLPLSLRAESDLQLTTAAYLWRCLSWLKLSLTVQLCSMPWNIGPSA